MLTQKQNPRLLAMGEGLIDFVPAEPGKAIRDVSSFLPAVGGAPCNVCAVFAKLGGESAMISQFGRDHFGDKIVAELEENGVDCTYIRRTDEANTSLAFVALKEDGGREFSFYRNPAADMLYREEYLKPEWFDGGYAFHFCSVSLGDFPMKEAHRKAIAYAKEVGMLVSYDPNLRPALWESEEKMVAAVREFVPYADILKVSDEEIELIAGTNQVEKAVETFFAQGVSMVLYTKGGDGAEVYMRTKKAAVPGIRVKAVDTTGAGDGFIGAFLFGLWREGITKQNLEHVSEETLEHCLAFANRFCSISVTKKGAIRSYPTLEEVEQ